MVCLFGDTVLLHNFGWSRILLSHPGWPGICGGSASGGDNALLIEYAIILCTNKDGDRVELQCRER